MRNILLAMAVLTSLLIPSRGFPAHQESKGAGEGQKGDASALHIRISRVGNVVVDGKEYSKDAFKGFLVERSKASGNRDPDNPSLVSDILKVEADGETPCGEFQRVLMTAARCGFWNIRIVKFKEHVPTEGGNQPKEEESLHVPLPRDTGISQVGKTPDMAEVRLKISMDKETRKIEILVGTLPIGHLEDRIPSSDGDALWRKAAEEIKSQSPTAGTGRHCVIVVDVDPQIPWKHLTGAVGAICARGIEKIEFAANSGAFETNEENRIYKLIEELGSSDEEIHTRAAGELIEIGVPAVPFLTLQRYFH